MQASVVCDSRAIRNNPTIYFTDKEVESLGPQVTANVTQLVVAKPQGMLPSLPQPPTSVTHCSLMTHTGVHTAARPYLFPGNSQPGISKKTGDTCRKDTRPGACGGSGGTCLPPLPAETCKL